MPMTEKLSLLDTAFLLRCYCKPIQREPLSQEDDRSTERLMSMGLIEFRPADGTHFAALYATERAKVYCEYLRDIPLPVASWSMPSQEGKSSEGGK